MATPAPGLVPAQLGFLAVFNPSLAANDESVEDQIVYYASVNGNGLTGPQSRRRRRSKADRPTEEPSQEERNERLRQIGLAQGIVEFGKSFSGDQAVDTIDAEKTRIVLHELEPGWWILASIDLTRVPLPPARPAGGSSAPASSMSSASGTGPDKGFEYSSREVKSPALLLQDLLRAHSVFLLHHDSSLSALFVRSKRTKFVSMLGRYWDLYLSTWNVMLHGNPICNVLGGIRLAASGELGVGVGEEDRGSGEREVLEGLIGRTDGLVDLVVGKFGDGDSGNKTTCEEDRQQAGHEQWLGTGQEPGAEDGAIFLGVGTLSRHSLRDLVYWMEDMYTWGENAYGVFSSPTATRLQPKRRRAATANKRIAAPPSPDQGSKADSKGAEEAPAPESQGSAKVASRSPAPGEEEASRAGSEAEGGGVDKLISYLKLGYGTSWSLGTSPSGGSEAGSPKTEAHIPPAAKEPTYPPKKQPKDDSAGHFLVGLIGDVEETGSGDDEADTSKADLEEDAASNARTMVRTVTIELESVGEDRPEAQRTKDFGSQDTELSEQRMDEEGKAKEGANTTFDSQDRNKTKRLRVVVYVNRPFVFIFLFHLRTDSLAWDGLYRSLHYQLAPLRKPLMASTAYRPERPDVGAAQMFDLIWDPTTLKILSTVPNIPSPIATGQPSWVPATAQSRSFAWNRLEALNTHLQLLNIYAATRNDITQLEHTAKTSRGWWIVWNRIRKREIRYRSSAAEAESSGRRGSDGDRDSGIDEPTPIEDYVITKEIFLVRKAGDHSGGVRGASVLHISSPEIGGAWTDGASRMAQGIGVDTRRYIQGLLNLN